MRFLVVQLMVMMPAVVLGCKVVAMHQLALAGLLAMPGRAGSETALIMAVLVRQHLDLC